MAAVFKIVIEDNQGNIYIPETTSDMVIFDPSGTGLMSETVHEALKELSLDAAASAVLNRPDLWAIGEEYDFGSNLYGRRFAGSITSAADTQATSTLLPAATAVAVDRLIEAGGHWELAENRKASVCAYQTSSVGGKIVSSSISFVASGDLALLTVSTTARSARPYDVWVKYTK